MYELLKYGTYNGLELNLGPIVHGMKGFTPIWIKINSENDKNYFIFFNQEWKQWEVHEESRPSDRLTEDQLSCKTGSSYHAFNLFEL